MRLVGRRLTSGGSTADSRQRLPPANLRRVISTKRLLFNAATFIPGVAQLPPVQRVFKRHSIGTHGTIEARYCYSVWLRHLMCAAANGLDTNPRAVAELGPGDSIGIGIASVLTGVERYFAFDVVAHANTPRNLAIFDGLVELFRAQADIPDASEYPRVGPTLNDYRFPGHILTPDRMRAALDPARLARVRESIQRTDQKDSMIQYRAPWSTAGAVEHETLDLVFSQATLEHVDGLPDVYRAMYAVAETRRLHVAPDRLQVPQLRPRMEWPLDVFGPHVEAGARQGRVAHQPPALLRARRAHGEKPASASSANNSCARHRACRRSQLASQFREIPDSDLTTTDAFVQAVKMVPDTFS